MDWEFSVQAPPLQGGINPKSQIVNPKLFGSPLYLTKK
ncbi:hypothetical protein NSP_31620 [Nodularia spumigena CCY9414]|nr:hypothetical protein NSP_31620 [Nodularia spumigena CCY9414]